MRVILEGPDNAGKTTLATFLRETGVEYFHPGGPPKDFWAEVDNMIEQRNKLGVGGHLIMDRVTCISQQVYNASLNLDPIRAQYLAELLQVRPIIVYCRPSTDRLMRKEDLTWRDGETEEHKQKIIEGQHRFIERYDALMSRTPHIAYNFEEPQSSNIRAMLLNAFSDEMVHGDLHHFMHHQKVY